MNFKRKEDMPEAPQTVTETEVELSRNQALEKQSDHLPQCHCFSSRPRNSNFHTNFINVLVTKCFFLFI